MQDSITTTNPRRGFPPPLKSLEEARAQVFHLRACLRGDDLGGAEDAAEAILECIYDVVYALGGTTFNSRVLPADCITEVAAELTADHQRAVSLMDWFGDGVEAIEPEDYSPEVLDEVRRLVGGGQAALQRLAPAANEEAV